MEILATVEYKGFYYFFLILSSCVSIFFLGMFIYGIIDAIKNVFGRNEFFAIVFCLLVSAMFGYLVHMQLKTGVHTEYKATITDFNEVYDNGYEITGQEGKLYILEKKVK